MGWRWWLAGAAVSWAVPLWAQTTESADIAVGGQKGDVPVATGQTYLLPDIAPAPVAAATDRAFTLRPHLVVLLDQTWFEQDAASLAQVGEQADQFEVRAARVQLLGTIGTAYRLNYQVSAEYKGFDSDPNTTWQLTDLNVTFPLGAGAKLILGKQKQTFVYEMVGDAANLASSERVLSPFFVSRNTGARLLAVIGPRRMATISAGVYNTAWDIQAAEQRGIDVTARGTVLLWDDPERHNFLHLGVAGRFVGSEGELRYRGRPGSNVASNFVDTGKFAADGAFHTGLEAMLGLGPVQFMGEYAVADVDAPERGNPRFHGWYLTASWVLTGEARPYDRNVGYARRVIPEGRWGAPEIALRYARVDLNDEGIEGGAFERVDAGLNWWATRRWKAGVVWGRVWLNRLGEEGRTDTLLTRLQWVY